MKLILFLACCFLALGAVNAVPFPKADDVIPEAINVETLVQKMAVTATHRDWYLPGHMVLPSSVNEGAIKVTDGTMTVAKCLAECAERPTCKSFDIYKNNECFMRNVNSAVGLTKDHRVGAITHYDVCTEFPCYVKSVYAWKDPRFANYMLKDAMAKRIVTAISKAYVCPGPKEQSVSKYLKFDTPEKLKEYEDLQSRAFNPNTLGKYGPRQECTYDTNWAVEKNCWLSMIIKGGVTAPLDDVPVTKTSWEAGIQGAACTLCASHTDSCMPHAGGGSFSSTMEQTTL